MHYVTSVAGITEDRLNGFFVGWRAPLTPLQHLRLLQNSEHVVLAIDDATDQVVGFINALTDGVNHAFIPLLEVLPAYQGQDIGSALVERMLALLAPLSCIDLMCDPELQPFYQRFGMHKSVGMILRKY